MTTKINLKNFANAQQRRTVLEKEQHVNLSSLVNFSFTEEQVQNKNIENLIGAVSVPVGVAGPLTLKGKFAQGNFYIPLATTEGALVASVSRGCKVLSKSENFLVKVEDVGITRGAVFKVSDLNQAQEFLVWLKENFVLLANVVKQTSNHLQLLQIDPQIIGRNVFVRFVFCSFDAMGMNMASKAVTLMAQEIAKLGISCLAVAGNFDIDKKPAWLNFLKGRGKKAWAEATIPSSVVNDVLKTTPEKIHEVVIKKCLIGSIASGSLGFNAHFGNIIAALFCATGQDLAHVTEGSLGITTTEITAGGLYCSVYLPDLIIGTVGGGTGLPAQQEALNLLQIPDANLGEGKQVLKLAEIVAGAVLAGEISLLGALAAGDLDKAHEKLGKGKK